MAQGFKRTGNAVSTKKPSGNAASSSGGSTNKIKKGARFIAPKKAAAMARINLTHKLTTQLNRRAESALITRLGSNREGTLKLVRPDSRIVDELMAKKAKKEAGRNGSVVAPVAVSKKGSEKVSETMNSLSKSALQHLNEQESLEASSEVEENDEE